MDIKYALLGFLSWQPFSGYDLKKILESSDLFYWSGNNNQIYTGLVQLHKDGLVDSEARPSEKMPNRKVYRINPQGQAELKRWLLTEPEMPQLRKPFLIQLAWSRELTTEETVAMLTKYEDEINLKVLMLKEQLKRGVVVNPARTERERYLWQRIFENYLNNYSAELDWVRDLEKNITRF